MSYYILSESEKSFERTIVYKKQNENFVDIITQKRFNGKDDWTTQQPCMLPKFYINFIAELPEKPSTDSFEGSYITSGGITPPSKISQLLVACDISILPVELKKILYKYECETVPFFENQLGVVQACDHLADLWVLPRSPDSPSIPTPATTPAKDPSPTVSPTSTQASPSLFSEINGRKFSSHENFSGLWNNLSGTHFETPVKRQESDESDITPETNEVTPVNRENPIVCKAPRKRKTSTNLRELFGNSE